MINDNSCTFTFFVMLTIGNCKLITEDLKTSFLFVLYNALIWLYTNYQAKNLANYCF